MESGPAHSPEDYSILAARIAGAHGVTGNVRLRLIGSEAGTGTTARSLQRSRVARAVSPDGEHVRWLTLASLRKQTSAKGAWIATFQEIKDRTEAQSLSGYALYIPEDARAPLPENEYYVDQLRGLSVVTDRDRPLGRLVDVLNAPAHDVYVTDRDVLIPAVPAFILDIDLDRKTILVHDVPGLGDGD